MLNLEKGLWDFHTNIHNSLRWSIFFPFFFFEKLDLVC